MFEGLWTVEFISMINRSGKGVLVLKDGRLFGGDSSYYYRGDYKSNGNHIEGTLLIIRHDPTGISVFGDIDSFKISFSGEANDLHFSGIGSIVNMPNFKVKIIANKKEDF